MTSKQKSSTDLNAQRRLAVQLRLSGSTLADVRAEVGLSTPTIVAAVKAFKSGGWPAVDVKPRGRPKHTESNESDVSQAQASLVQTLANEPNPSLWSTLRVAQWLKQEHQVSVSQQTAATYLQTWQLLPPNHYREITESNATAPRTWLNGEFKDFKTQAKKQGSTILWTGLRTLSNGATQLHAHTLRGRVVWMQLNEQPNSNDYQAFFKLLEEEFPKGIALTLPNKHLAAEAKKFSSNKSTSDEKQALLFIVAPILNIEGRTMTKPENKPDVDKTKTNSLANSTLGITPSSLTHLQRLEAESIQIMREVVAEADNPVMLYSIGKDSAVMLHLARKAFYPASPPFPLLHVDTTWKFQEMYRFRDTVAKDMGFEILKHVNPEGIEKQVSPFTHGSALHTDIMKTQGLKQALDKHGFDVALGGARRDEEKSRAKERVFSFRTSQHRWEPKSQRPELWNLYNTRKQPGESIRVFPISNWTELDVWQYIHLQDIPLVPLYYAAERPVVERDGTLIMVDDDRMPLKEGEVPMMRKVRFRTLGCYPLTGAVESNATTTPEIIQEMLLTKTSERQGRMIDHDTAASMEKKKQEGYF